MRVFLVAHTANVDNPNQLLLTLLRNRSADVEPICVFLEEGPDVQAVRDLGVDARAVRAGRTREVWRLPPVVLTLAGLMRRRRIDVIVSQTSKAQVYAGPASHLAHVPSVWVEHEVAGCARGSSGQERWLQYLAGHMPNRLVLCTSEFVARHHRDRWPKAAVRRVYAGVETAGSQPRTHVATHDAHVAVVGRLQRWRRVELALKAFAQVLREEPRTRLHVIGDARTDVDADYPAELRMLAVSLGVDHAVEFLGRVPDAANRLGEMDLLLHPADREPFGQIVLEALLRGVPAIVPPVGGPAEIVRAGVDGLVVDPTDSARFGEAIVALARDPARRNEMGAAGRLRVLERFDARRTAAETWSVLEEVANGRRASDPA
jgi:glycosyltransferase involved in cell wall biosynthesis